MDPESEVTVREAVKRQELLYGGVLDGMNSVEQDGEDDFTETISTLNEVSEALLRCSGMLHYKISCFVMMIVGGGVSSTALLSVMNLGDWGIISILHIYMSR